ncbi:MAG: hypothetical protein V4692_07580 [Bdellovibrionota bacterium]
MNRMLKHFVLSVLTIFLSVSVLAKEGGDVVGNGGGLAELQITKLWALLDSEVAICFKGQNVCGLDNEDSKTLQTVITSRKAKKSAPVDFYFDPEKVKPVFAIEPGITGKIFFNADSLYSAPGIPASLSVIMGYAIAAELTRSTGMPIEESLLVGERVGQFWKSSRRVFESQVWSYPVRFMLSESRVSSSFNYEIYIEYSLNSYDITPLFKDAIGCKLHRNGLKIVSASLLSEMIINGQMVYDCESGEKYFADFQVTNISTGFQVALYNVRRR